MAAHEIDDEQDGERHAEEPEECVTNLAGFADELFEFFHNKQGSPHPREVRVSEEIEPDPRERPGGFALRAAF